MYKDYLSDKLVNPKIASYRIVFDIDAENLIVLRIGHGKKLRIEEFRS